MTHGDKAKAKAGNKSQASAKAHGAKSGENGKGGGQKGAAKGGKVEAGTRKKSVDEKGSPAKAAAAGAKERAAESASRAKGRADDGVISDPRLAAAFKHAVKKFPNAFRKLTD